MLVRFHLEVDEGELAGRVDGENRMTYVTTANALNLVIPSLYTTQHTFQNEMQAIARVKSHTTAFTIPVRSAQIVPPIPNETQ